jgi:hypothetical protein
MTKHLLASAAAVVLMSGVASAQIYPPAPPPQPYPPAPPPQPYPAAPPPIGVAPPAPGSSTTTVAPTPDGGYRASTTKKGVDASGNEVTKKDVYKEGVEGSSETHTKIETDPLGGTTRSTTTTTAPR